MEGCLKHEWTETNWTGGKNFVEGEKGRQRQWEEMTDEEYEEAGHYFDLMESHSSPCLKNWAEKQDEVYKKREKELKELIDKKNNFPPVSNSFMNSKLIH